MRYYHTLTTTTNSIKKTMTQDELKQKVAYAALDYVKGVSIVGVTSFWERGFA